MELRTIQQMRGMLVGGVETRRGWEEGRASDVEVYVHARAAARDDHESGGGCVVGSVVAIEDPGEVSCRRSTLLTCREDDVGLVVRRSQVIRQATK